MDEIRMVLFLAMFFVLAWCDFRTRMISDRIFLAFGAAGAALYLLDWQATNGYEVLVMLCSAGGAVMLWRLRLAGTADALAIITGAVIHPVHLGIIPTMLALFVFATALSAVSVVAGNALLNASDAMRRGGVFGDVSEEWWRKCLAFFMVHRQRVFDRHAFLAENVVDGRRRFKLGHKPVGQAFAEPSDTQYVEYAVPFLTVAAVPASVLVALALLSPVGAILPV